MTVPETGVVASESVYVLVRKVPAPAMPPMVRVCPSTPVRVAVAPAAGYTDKLSVDALAATAAVRQALLAGATT